MRGKLVHLAGAMLAALALAVSPTRALSAEGPSWSWYRVDSAGDVRVHLYLFWSARCPHCPGALSFVGELKQRYSWLDVYTYEITTNPANAELYRQMAVTLQKPAAGQVPAFVFCKQLEIGYDDYATHGARLERSLLRWYQALKEYHRKRAAATSPVDLLPAMVILLEAPPPPEPGEMIEMTDLPDLPVEVPEEEPTVALPVAGEVEVSSLSLPLLTLVLAGCDAFNPCAFFVLLFLLSLLIHTRSRWRMLLVGGVFVFFSGLLYFLFMAAWLNLFVVVGHLAWITTLAGVVAVAAALVNVKDFFFFKKGFSLSIPEQSRAGLFQRMTGLLRTTSLLSLLAGTVMVAAVANLYELLCTSGFPLVYTRVLTLRQLPTATYYVYLAAYNLIYVIPLALIVLVFALTLGSRKLSEYEGRVLKLLSGLMMLVLGILLLTRPEILSTALGGLATLGVAVGLTALLVLVDRLLRPAAGDDTGLPHRPGLPGREGEARQLSRHSSG